MQRYQLLLGVGGFVLVFVLFFLPRSVVKNPEKTIDKTLQSDEKQPSTASADHTSEVNPAKRAEINLLLSGFLKKMDLPSLMPLAQAYREVSLFDSAAHYYALFAEKEQNPQAFCQAGDAYFEAYSLALREESIAFLSEKLRFYLQKCIDSNPKNYDARVKMGISYVSGKQPMAGIQMIRKVLEEDPKNTLAILNLGVFSMQSNQIDKAVERFRQLIDIEPKNPQGYLYLGTALLQMGQQQEAKNQLQKAMQLGKGTEIETVAKDYLETIK